MTRLGRAWRWLAALVMPLGAKSDVQIPRVLVTSHKFPLDTLPKGLAGNIELWRSLNLGWGFAYFDNAGQERYMHDTCAVPRCVEAYDISESGAARADLFRVAYLYYTGGFWFDSDVKAGSIDGQCDLPHAYNESLFLIREPKRGHIRYMVMGGSRHPLLLANLYRQINNTIRSKRDIADARANGRKVAFNEGALHITGPFTLGKTLCDPFHFASTQDLGDQVGLEAAAAQISPFCSGGFFDGGSGRGDRPKAIEPWADSYAPSTPLAFRFDSCQGHWHRPGAKGVNYMADLIAMNLTHHTHMPA
mmetsp:Transcript_55013/g.75192  ORF Transcript_55013/g.75192 Transcript_55013/m.75192 type:complete len:305 (-) Transcript_55013:257-1171(-)